MTDLLKIEHLSKRYPGFALQDVSFTLKQGRIMGLVGKNGAGKSTILKSMLNIVKTDQGTVTMFGKDFLQNEKSCKQNIGVVFGGIDFYPLKKLSAITAVTRTFYQEWDQQKYENYLRQFSLDENKIFKSLSNGMKVKYLLALSLSHNARLYLLDEPTSGLDPVSRDEILHIFTRIVKEKEKSVLFSTHITSDLDHCADDITYIQRGQVLKSSDKETFLRSFDYLKSPEDTGELTLEEIMLRTERSDLYETAL